MLWQATLYDLLASILLLLALTKLDSSLFTLVLQLPLSSVKCRRAQYCSAFTTSSTSYISLVEIPVRLPLSVCYNHFPQQAFLSMMLILLAYMLSCREFSGFPNA